MKNIFLQLVLCCAMAVAQTPQTIFSTPPPEDTTEKVKNIAETAALFALIGVAICGCVDLISGILDLIFKVPKQVNHIDKRTQEIGATTSEIHRTQTRQDVTLQAMSATTSTTQTIVKEQSQHMQELLRHAQESNQRTGQILTDTQHIKQTTDQILQNTARIQPLEERIIRAIEDLKEQGRAPMPPQNQNIEHKQLNPT